MRIHPLVLALALVGTACGRGPSVANNQPTGAADKKAEPKSEKKETIERASVRSSQRQRRETA